MDKLLELRVVCGADVETYTLTEFPVRLGRDRDCEVHLPYSFVSRRHATIVHEGTKYVLVDDGSFNGISHHGRRVAHGERIELVDGSEFYIDRLVATVSLSELTLPMRVAERGCEGTTLYSEQHVLPDVLTRVGVVMEKYREVRAETVQAVARTLHALEDGERAAAIRLVASLHPELTSAPELLSLLEGEGELEALRTIVRR